MTSVVQCSICSEALSHDHIGVRCTSDLQHCLCAGVCSITFCSSKLNELNADAFPPACSMCSEPITLASFDAHLNEEQRSCFLGHAFQGRDEFRWHQTGRRFARAWLLMQMLRRSCKSHASAHAGAHAHARPTLALMLAANRGHTETVVPLLTAPGIVVNAADGAGWTALICAAFGGHTETVAALLTAPGIDVNAANGAGITALIWASDGGHTKTVATLLTVPIIELNAAGADGETALIVAANKGHADAVLALLAAPGVDVNAADGEGLNGTHGGGGWRSHRDRHGAVVRSWD